MSESNGLIQWSEDQWNRVRQVVHDEAHRARVAASFLPLYGPLAADVETVPAQTASEPEIDDKVRGESKRRLTVNDHHMMRLTTVAANVYLRTPQAAQEDLSSALIMFRRAANIIARVEDALVFNGQPGEGQPPVGHESIPPIFEVTGGGNHRGLNDPRNETVDVSVTPDESPGQAIVRSVVQAISILELHGHLAPFALALGNDLYGMAYDPTDSLVLPSDRIKPLLDGPLVRSSLLPADQGVIVSLSGNPVDLVVASDISVKFLQLNLEPRYVFRVCERILLRVKESCAIVTLLRGPKIQSKRRK